MLAVQILPWRQCFSESQGTLTVGDWNLLANLIYVRTVRTVVHVSEEEVSSSDDISRKNVSRCQY